jgi:hypothetical protein
MPRRDDEYDDRRDEEPGDRDDRRDRYDRPDYERPHRGGLVLAFGIISIVMPQCGIGLILGILAWVWGNADLRAMEAGEMDPEGRSLTHAGKICGMVGTAFGVLMILAGIAYLLFFVAFFAAMPAPAPPAPPPPAVQQAPAPAPVAPQPRPVDD